MGRNQMMCGALTGGVMVIGLLFGRNSGGGEKDKAYSSVDALFNAFGDKFGTLDCRELVEVDLRSEEGQRLYHERNLHLEKCSQYVAFVADWLLSLKR